MAIVCNCPGKCQIHPKPPEPTPVGSEPHNQNPVAREIAAEDKLTLKTLEAAWLQCVVDESKARQQIEAFGSALYEKLSLSPQQWSLDIKKLIFTPR